MIGTGVIVKGEFKPFFFWYLHQACALFSLLKQYILLYLNLKEEYASFPAFSSSYGGRRPLGGSYLMDRDNNEPEKAVTENSNSSDGRMAMAQTMDSKDDKKE